MSEKYVNIEQESCNRTQDQKEALMEIASHDIIFVLSYPDTQYPSYSDMNMGQFCEVAYRRGNKIIWQVFNPEVTKPIDDFLDKLGERVSPIVERGAFTTYIGKPSEKFRVVEHDLIYDNKYRFCGDRYMINFDSIFENIERVKEVL